jgi:hypothetical protein
MSQTTKRRERVLHLIREERSRQIQQYGSNDNLLLGFGSSVSAYPWLLPYSDAESGKIEAAFRADYEQYENSHGQPTWMHLIREEVAELFAARHAPHAVSEAIQVAALCVSLVENLLESQGVDE